MTILLVDDEQLLLDNLESSLSKEPTITTILKALAGMDALKLCSTNLPDIVITDICMSPMDGLALTQELKNYTLHYLSSL